MRSAKSNSISVQVLIAAAAGGQLDEALARQLYRHGPEVVTLALLAASKRIAEQEVVIAGLKEQTHYPDRNPHPLKIRYNAKHGTQHVVVFGFPVTLL